MKKNKFKIFVVLLSFILPCLISCNEEYNNKRAALDFGTVKFKEPFTGILKSRPNILVESIKYPPYSWVIPDTLSFEKTAEIEVNEEYLRGNVRTKFALVDFNGQPYKKAKFWINNTPIEKYEFIPKQENTRLKIKGIIDPSIGETDISGNLIVLSKGLDLINNRSVSTEKSVVMDWNIHQMISINWLLWFLWLLSILLIIALIILLVIGLLKLLSFLLSTLQVPNLPQFHFKRQKYRTKNKYRNDDDYDDEEVDNCKLHPYLRKRQNILLSSSPVREKAVALYEAFQFYDYNLSLKPDYRAKQFELLDLKIKSAFDDFWNRGKFYISPKSNGIWTGESKNSTWIPDDNFVPKNKLYNNQLNKSWKRIKSENNFKGLRFEKGRAIFADIAIHSVTLKNFAKLISPFDYSERSNIHNEAFRILAKKLNKSIEYIQKYKEENNYVWHEDHDCYTLYLVPREIHDNINHFGGIGMLQILRNNRLV